MITKIRIAASILLAAAALSLAGAAHADTPDIQQRRGEVDHSEGINEFSDWGDAGFLSLNSR
ncbi:hypothetical protein OG898_28565 [Streptomyces sp. NBC_00193]|uniref:hypothetical protein n=1 Tax=unclassified Streptomyces TaxID=2593676 RepID=UPI002253A83B|nr:MULTISPECIES: hypothetical protein [unclassified Streptomyces]MCX5129937.1 hypothetical protein [Streptomyces sp. NBC_00347]MCX5300384.1 hypothetical protein [Streptomyces sp. NBC_00193]